VAHTRQSRPDSGHGFQVKVLNPFVNCIEPFYGTGFRVKRIGQNSPIGGVRGFPWGVT